MVDFVFGPAVRLMKRFSYSRKILLLSAVLLVPIVILIVELSVQLGADIEFVSQERKGVEYLDPTLGLLQHVQQHRGAASTFLKGDQSFKTLMLEKQSLIEADLAAIDLIEQKYASEFQSGDRWGRIKSDWLSLQQEVNGLSAAESFSRHTDLISKILAFRVYIADKSNLSLDPNAEIYFLMISTVKSYPQTAEMLGQIRAIGSGALVDASLTDSERVNLEVLVRLATTSSSSAVQDVQQALDANAEMKTRLENMVQSTQADVEAFTELVSTQVLSGDTITITSKEFFDAATKVIDGEMTVASELGSATDELLTGHLQELSRQRLLSFSLAGIPLLVEFWLIVGFYLSVQQAVNGAKAVTEQIAEGNVTSHYDYQANDEMGQLANSIRAMLAYLQNMAGVFEKMSFNDLTESVTPVSEQDALSRYFSKMISNLRRSIGEVSESGRTLYNVAGQLGSKTNIVAAAAEELSANTASVAAGMEQANTSLHAVAVAVEEMTATAGEIAKSSEKAQYVTENAAGRVDQFSRVMRDLGDSAQEIGKVTETINSISSQTNLLALNATIEAARAGAAGKGFAVVASEIKELAKQTSDATNVIREKISGIQASATNAVADIDDIVQVMSQVNETVISIASAIREQSLVTQDIAGNISQASLGVRDASSRVSETAVVTNSIAREIAELSGVSEAASTGEIKASVTTLLAMAQSLQEIVRQFRLEKSDKNDLQSEIETFKQAHLTWIKKAEDMQQGGVKIQPGDVPSHTQCSLGRWYYGVGSTQFSQKQEFIEIAAPHQRFHEALRSYVETFHRQGKSAAEGPLGQLKSISVAIINQLDQLKKSV